MATRFSYRERASRKGRSRMLAATGLVVVLLIADALSGGAIRSLARSASAGIIRPVFAVGATLTANGYFKSHGALAAENTQLRAQLEAMQARDALQANLKSQISDLQSLVHLATTTPGVTAPITSSFIASPYGTFLIGAGTGEGVAAGQLVLSPEGVVLGRVTSAGMHTATALQLFAPGQVVNAHLAGATVVVTGQGGGNATIKLPHGIVAKAGDVVTAPEYGDRPIGVVGHVEDDPASAEVDVYVGLPVNLSALRYVYVTN